jgi:iron complex outermembrane receptor protein
MKSTKVIRRKKLAATISLLLAACPSGYALAEDQDATTEGQSVAGEATAEEEMVAEEVIVTGIRRGLMQSLDIKENSTSIVEAISAEDIGKLPDQSITDSLARLPGVTAQRLNGRSQVLSVRGLGPDFTTALLNGRPQVSTGDNRGVEFDQYPAEMISAAVVYKTPNATLMGQGLAGTVDLQTIRPLEYGKQAMVANARYEWNDLSALNDDADDTGWRGSFSWVDQFMDDTLGISIGIAYLDTPSQSERFNSWGYPTDTPEGAAVIGGAKPYAQSNELERTGITGTLEYAPSDTFRTTLDLYYSDFQETQLLRGIELPLWWSSAQLQPGYTVNNGLVETGSFANVKGVMRNDVNERDSELWSAGWNLEFDLDDNWSLIGDLSYSEVDRTDIILETYSGTGPAGVGATDTLGFQMRSGQGVLFFPTLNYADPSIVFLTSPQGWGSDVVAGGQLGYDNRPTIEDELTMYDARARYTFDSGWLGSVDFGLNYQTRTKTKVADEWFLSLASGEFSAPLPTPYIYTDLSFLGIPSMVGYDALAAVNSGIYTRSRNPNADVVIKSWEVEEDLTTLYAMASFDADVFSDKALFGNFGFQWVNTDQSSSAQSATGGGASLTLFPTSGGDDYDEILPSLNMALGITDSQFLRFAYARSLARARMDQMRAGVQYGFDISKVDSTDINNSPWSGSAGNPALRPWLADAFDLSWEQYFKDGLGYVALAGFYKDLDTWVIDDQVVFDFTGFPQDEQFDPALSQGLITIPVNGSGGSIDGFEFSFSLDFGMFWPAVEGLGLLGSASWTNSDIQDSGGSDINIPGLSEDVYNLTAYYETERFSIRLSARDRSDFLGEVSGFGAGRDFRQVQGETVLDGQASWFFGGSLTGLSLLFQAYNITDEEFTTFSNDDVRQVIDFQRYGSTYLLGASYSF